MWANGTLILALVMVGRQPWRTIQLELLIGAAAIYAATNVYYGAAFFGRSTNWFDLYDAAPAETVRFVQIGTMWAMLIFSAQAVYTARQRANHD